MRRKQQGVPAMYSPGARVLAFCLLFAVVAWDYAACAPGLRDLPALLCQRLGHHSRPAPAGMPCCPLPTSFPVQQPSQKSCCAAPTSSQDAIPSAKQDGACNAICCMRVVTHAVPPRTAFLLLPFQSGHRYEHEVFDLKMDMRI
ncbi:MAG TPA: hypothetical protein VKH40_13270 [Alloacidobacterium sp.]|nr:hypothetical protein [Alloacidobacterium sp.]